MHRLQRIGCAAAISVAILTMDAAQPQQEPSSAVNREVPWLPSDAIRLPDKNSQIEMQDQKARNKKFQIANAARKKQMEDDAALLLQLATELKTEVDKTGAGTLSPDEMRKADNIEKLARGVKEKMKLTIF
jgi:hypothetical protein